MKHSIIGHLRGHCDASFSEQADLKSHSIARCIKLEGEVKTLTRINEGLQKELITEKGAFDYRVLELEKAHKEKIDSMQKEMDSLKVIDLGIREIAEGVSKALQEKAAEEKPKEAEDLKEKFESHKGRILPIREVTEDTGWPKPKRKKQWDGPRYPREMKATTKFPKES